MGKLNPFKKPKKPDTSAADKAARELAAKEKRLAADEAAQKSQDARKRKAAAAARRGRKGRTSLLRGLETGVEKRKNFG